MSKINYILSLTEAKVDAAKKSRAENTRVYIVVNDDGDCGLSYEPIPDATTAVYKNGSEISLDADSTTTVAPKMKRGKKVSTVKSTAENVDTKIKSNVVKTKKVVKKTAASPKVDRTITAASITEGIKKFLAAKLGKGVIKIGGKEYSVKKGVTWVLSKGLVEKGKSGIVMLIDGQKGHYLYPASDYKKVFKSIFASGTWKKHGSYGQSTFSGTHDVYWHD